MINFIKNQIKKLFFMFLKKENKKIIKILSEFETDLNILDVGATGGVQKKWYIIENLLNVFMVEPNHNSTFDKNNFKTKNLISNLFSDTDGKIIDFNITKFELCSSVEEPNFSHLSRYKGEIGEFSLKSFELKKKITARATTIDKVFKYQNLDFIKIDVEGHHYEILNGAKEKLKTTLGLEVECEFFQLRKNHKLFPDVNKFLTDNNFEFIDFLIIHRWERYKFRYTGQPQVADILFLKKPEDIIKKFNNKKISQNTLFKYLIILTIYNRVDLIKFIVNNLDEDIVKKYHLDSLCNLVEKKINRINKFKRFEFFISQSVNNEI